MPLTLGTIIGVLGIRALRSRGLGSSAEVADPAATMLEYSLEVGNGFVDDTGDVSEDAPPWAARNWWDAAGDNFGSSDHDFTAAYAYTAIETFGPFSLAHPPDQGEIWSSDRPSMNGQTLIAYVKLGLCRSGQVVREWRDERDVQWWTPPTGHSGRRYEFFVHDRTGQPESWHRHWFPLGGAQAVEAVRHDAERLSRLTDDVVLWGRVLGVIDMH